MLTQITVGSSRRAAPLPEHYSYPNISHNARVTATVDNMLFIQEISGQKEPDQAHRFQHNTASSL